MTQKEHKKIIHSYAEPTIEKFDSIWNKIPKREKQVFDIPNIGVTYRDKLEELAQFYQEKGLSFYTSSLQILIRRYLEHFIEQGFYNLQGFITSIEYSAIEHLVLPNKKTTPVVSLERLLKRYHYINEQVRNFDLGIYSKNIIYYDMELWNQLEKDGSPNLYREIGFPTLYAYNQELRKLGYSTRSYILLGAQHYRDNMERIKLQKQTQIYFQLHNQPILTTALNTRISDLVNEATVSYNNKDFKSANQLIEKLLEFHIKNEIVDSVGNYIVNYHGMRDLEVLWERIKKELTNITQDNVIPSIEKDIQDKQYQKCVNQ